MLYSNQFATGNKPIGLASLAAVLKEAGHEFHLFDCTNYSVAPAGTCEWNLAGVKNLAFKLPKNSERLPRRQRLTYIGLQERLLRSIDQFKPDIVGLSALTDDYPLGLGLMREAKKTFPRIPTVAGGVHASVDPAGVIDEDCFDLLCVGEGEHVIIDIAERVDQSREFSGIANLWVKHPDGRIERNAVRPFEQNLDRFPFPDWDIYGEAAFFKPYNGHVYKYGDFEMSRGCPYKCSYCINVQMQEVYRLVSPGGYHREKSIDRVIREIRFAIEKYGIEFLKFWDETFLLMGKERMEEFCDKYSTEIGLPYVMETTAESITDFSAKVLQKTNCKSASIGMETGDPDMRTGLLHKPTGNQVYEEAFRLLGQYGIQKVSFNMIGLPNESQGDIFRTIGMNRLVGTFTHSVGIFYPYKGVPIREMMERQGLMGEDFELKNLKDYDYNTFTAGNRSVVRFRDMDSRLLNRLWLLFATYVYWPVRLYPLIDYVKNNDGDFAVTLLNNLQQVTYFRKFDAWPPIDGTEPSDELTQQALEAVSSLTEERASEFASLLVEHWVGDGLDQLCGLLYKIASGALTADFPVPDDRQELARWLEINLGDEAALRQIRAELRGIAKDNSQIYAGDSRTV